jgi:excinuclease UvrABC ATPase subunit
VDEGHSLLVIEHNVDLIRCADWLIDLGPDAGDWGGELIAEGAPLEVAERGVGFTAQALKNPPNRPVHVAAAKQGVNRKTQGNRACSTH